METITELIKTGALFVFAGTTIIQIAPIKINPWTWIARKIGRAINGEVIEKVEKLEKDLMEMKEESAEQTAKGCRIRILRFGDEILHDVKHSKEHFDQILLDITDYETYCKDHPNFKNNMTVITTNRIKSAYERCFEGRNFL